MKKRAKEEEIEIGDWWPTTRKSILRFLFCCFILNIGRVKIV